MKYLLIAILAISGCERQQPNGGPCDYNIEAFKAEVTKIVTDSTGNYFTVYLHANNLSSNQLHELADRPPFTAAELEKFDLKPGRILKGDVHRITKGTCNPEIIIFEDSALKNY